MPSPQRVTMPPSAVPAAAAPGSASASASAGTPITAPVATPVTAPIADHPPGAMSSAIVVPLLTLLLGIQPVTTDLYLPALPTIGSALGTGTGGAQLTLSALVIVFGLAQLVCGPLSDRLGRRPVILGGLALYTLASAASALAPTIGFLVAARALQGAGMAAAVAGGRSIVRDLYPPATGARVMSRSLSGLGLLAMLSPLVGGALVQLVGWRAALAAPAVFGAGTLAFVALRFRETVPMRNPAATRPSLVLHHWVAVAAHPTFRAWVALLCCTYGGLFVYLAGSSFVLIGMLGVSRLAYGGLMALNSIAYIGGTVLCRRLLLRHGLRRTVKFGGYLSLAGGLGLAVQGGAPTVWGLVAAQALFSIGHGIHQPCGQAGSVGPFPEKAGTAAALSGFAMMVVAFAAGLLLGRLQGLGALPVTLGIGAFGIGVATVAWTLVQRHGEPAPPVGAAGVTGMGATGAAGDAPAR